MLRPQISDELIRQLIPNIQKTAGSERTWSDRLDPFISDAFATLERSIAPLAVIPPDLAPLATAFAVARAWAQAIPALDLVATPNGFAVVSNQTLAPASAARVAEARNAAVRRSSSLACRLIRNLHAVSDWRQTQQWTLYRSIFPVPDIYARTRREAAAASSAVSSSPRRSDFSVWLNDRSAVIEAEETIAHCLIGSAALNEARDIAAEAVRSEESEVSSEDNSSLLNPHSSLEEMEVLAILRSIVIRTASGTPPASLLTPHSSKLLRILDTEFTETRIAAAWRTSQQYRAFKSGPFKNKKSSPGYFL